MPELTGQTTSLVDLYWWLTGRPWWHAFSEAVLTPLWRWALNDSQWRPRPGLAARRGLRPRSKRRFEFINHTEGDE